MNGGAVLAECDCQIKSGRKGSPASFRVQAGCELLNRIRETSAFDKAAGARHARNG
jgi:hypothetical protein